MSIIPHWDLRDEAAGPVRTARLSICLGTEAPLDVLVYWDSAAATSLTKSSEAASNIKRLIDTLHYDDVSILYNETLDHGEFCDEMTSRFYMFYRVFKKVAPLKLFGIFSLPVKSFCVKFCKFVGNSYLHIPTNFCSFILIFHQMALICPRVPIVFTLSSFEYSPIKWTCSVPASEMTSFFRHRMS